MIKKGIIIFLFYSTTSFAQLYDLCGIWVGYNYLCYRVNPDSTSTLYYLDELIEIKQDGTHVTAIKITGDDCVTAGQITFQGNYTQPTFEVSVTVGGPLYPNSGIINGSLITVVDNNLIKSDFGAFYARATCSQIDNFQVDLSSLDIQCPVICDVPLILMPNAFTPNNDGINDNFIPGVYKNVITAQLLIYNRWGELVFRTEEPLKGWDGKQNNANCSNGVYVYVIHYTDFNNKTYTYKGTVTLLN